VTATVYDARYWLEHFLSVDALKMKTLSLKKYLKFCQNFVKDVVFPKKIKEEVMFMNRSVNYFAKNDQFEETNLNGFDNPATWNLKNYKVDKGEKI
jgi:hypothetical protein